MTIKPLKRQSINPPPTQTLYDQFHFSQATRVGDLIWVSGQVGIDSDMKPGEDVVAQTHLAFQSLAKVLHAAGASLADVVELTTFHTQLRADMPVFASIKDEYFPARYPSWTAVGVTELALPELVVEIRAVAVAGCAGT
ncbi:RidA family protein [Pseudomonas mosselii]|uniref:RidA family protein n=1 Tax=Pseudomonas mosselii TaxID=78327 RepID=UPI000A121A35|nr:RidA family protein [Pseudomonas mosselii]MDH1100427.1 RidA family protein [Pseudomonas mosselii]MDH1658447.1 RidA family protein [Pseudomonas mosselii]MDH1718273.1 RidA family protein [Pseudomonas mosselii]MDH1723876.1 RidA family protein [Pseudomonas mosselii]MDN4497320.1 RidA family protein [Pseudomonas mosselii]